ncbi:MAG: methionine--tRNA ligase, partial [Boseongicola sp.]|nr:methionine--tRNA ligase [Boseongicola sp.]
YETHMGAIEIRKSAAELRALWAAGNEYLQAAAPWTAFGEDPDRAAVSVRLAINLIRFYAVISAPFIPDASARMLDAMNTSDTAWPSDIGDALSVLQPGHAIDVPDMLFRKITDDERERWRVQFAGTRD